MSEAPNLPTRPWIVAVCDARDGVWNMAADVAQLEHTVTTGVPVLRLYAFAPATITLGRSESRDTVVDDAACAAGGVGVARRPTGGRAVLHDDEVTYCVTWPHADAAMASPAAGREAVAATVGTWLCEALRRLEVPAEIVRTSTPPRVGAGYRSCFASASRWEVAVDGRKIVGSAQRRWPQATLQHGSFLLGPGFRRLGEFLAVDRRHRAEAALELGRATCVSEARGRTAAWDEAVDALIATWTAHVPIADRWTGLPAALRARADRLATTGSPDPVWDAWAVRGTATPAAAATSDSAARA